MIRLTFDADKLLGLRLLLPQGTNGQAGEAYSVLGLRGRLGGGVVLAPKEGGKPNGGKLRFKPSPSVRAAKESVNNV